MRDQNPGEGHLCQLRLLIEELCCDLCRFEHVTADGLGPEEVTVDREFPLGPPGAYADIRIAPAGQAPYCVEIKYGYPTEKLIRHLQRKYRGADSDAFPAGSKVILVIDAEDRPDWAETERRVMEALGPEVSLEVWNERRLLDLMRERFRVDVADIAPEKLLEVRNAIDRAKGFLAFGGTSLAEYDHDPLRAELLWHFGFWHLRQLRSPRHMTEREILTPGLYRRVAVIFADLCSFSSYVRDTLDAEITRECLTSFYSKARYQIVNRGGMLYQFVGDAVIGFFGIPDRDDGHARTALDTALTLMSIGNSVSDHWQRRIDRVQPSGGLHVGLALGDIQLISLRPFSRTHIGAIGDCINVAARLTDLAGPGEVVVTNSFHSELDDERQALFSASEPVEARNVGRVRSWRFCGRPYEPDRRL